MQSQLGERKRQHTHNRNKEKGNFFMVPFFLSMRQSSLTFHPNYECEEGGGRRERGEEAYTIWRPHTMLSNVTAAEMDRLPATPRLELPLPLPLPLSSPTVVVGAGGLKEKADKSLVHSIRLLLTEEYSLDPDCRLSRSDSSLE